MEKEVDEILMLVEFYDDSDTLEKEYPNNYEFGEKIRNLILKYRNKLKE